MILDNEVEVTLNATTIHYWIAKGYTIPTHIDSRRRVKQFKKGFTRLSVKAADLPPYSNATINVKCCECGNTRTLPYSKYSDTFWSCNLRKQKGVDHPMYQADVVVPDSIRAFHLYLVRQYGITAASYLSMFEKQDYKCAICRQHQSGAGRKFAVDHSHVTGKIRGLLCQPCNTAIGLLKENVTTLHSAIEYLAKEHNND